MYSHIVGKKGEGEWLSYKQLEDLKGKEVAADYAKYKSLPIKRDPALHPMSTVLRLVMDAFFELATLVCLHLSICVSVNVKNSRH